MSATGRGAKRARLDDYSTPDWAIDAILDVLIKGFVGDTVLEPAAGEGAIVRRLLAYGIEASQIRAYELDPGRARQCRKLVKTWASDFLDAKAKPDEAYDLVIMNPPYMHALAFAQRGLQWLRPGGRLALLLRLNWLEGVRKNPRYTFLRETRPDVYVLPRRPKFGSLKGTDACAYGWFVWEKPQPGGVIMFQRPGHLYYLPDRKEE